MRFRLSVTLSPPFSLSIWVALVRGRLAVRQCDFFFFKQETKSIQFLVHSLVRGRLAKRLCDLFIYFFFKELPQGLRNTHPQPNLSKHPPPYPTSPGGGLPAQGKGVYYVCSGPKGCALWCLRLLGVTVRGVCFFVPCLCDTRIIGRALL